MSWAEVKKINSNLDVPLNEKMMFKRFSDYQNIMSLTSHSSDGSAFSFNFNEPSMIYKMFFSCNVSRGYDSSTAGQYLSRSINLTIDGEKVIDNASIGSMIVYSGDSARNVYVEFDVMSDPYEMTYTTVGSSSTYLYVPNVSNMESLNDFFVKNHRGSRDTYHVLKEWDGVPLSGDYDYQARTSASEYDYHTIWLRDKKPILANNIEISVSEVALLTGDSSSCSIHLDYKPIEA